MDRSHSNPRTTQDGSDSYNEFIQIHDEYARAWQQAHVDGETGSLEAVLAPSYHGHFGAPGMEDATPYDLSDGVAGMKESIRALQGADCLFTNRVVSMRPGAEAVVYYQKVIERDGTPLSSASILEVWRNVDGSWRLLRETTELGGTGASDR